MRWRLGIILMGMLAALLLLACGEGGGDIEPTPTLKPQSALPCQVTRNISSYRYAINIQLDMAGAPLASEGIGSAFSENSPLGAFAPLLFGLLSDLEIEGAFVAPDRGQAILSAGGDEIEVRTIGRRSWVRFGDVWQEETAPSRAVLLSPETVCREMVPALSRSLSGLDYRRQTVNGMASRHYHLDEGDVSQLGNSLNSTEAVSNQRQNFSLDIWLAEDSDWPLQVQLTASGKDEQGRPLAASLFLEFWDINSPDIEIELPANGRSPN